MTLEIKVEDLDLFTKVLNAAAAVLEDEGTFFATPEEGLTLRNMDKSRFAMVDLKIRPSYFNDGFKCDQKYVISIQMQDLKKILQRAGKEDVLTIRLDETNDTLIFMYEGRAQKRFVLPLSVSEESTLPDPSQLGADVTAKLQGGSLTDFIKDASIIGGSIKIAAKPGEMTFSSAQDKKEVSITIVAGLEHSAATEILTETPSESLYSIDTFKNLLLVDNAFTSVQLDFSSAKPLRLHYQDDRGIELGYLLAPMQPETEYEENSGSAYDDEDWDEDEDEDEDDDEDDDEDWDEDE